MEKIGAYLVGEVVSSANSDAFSLCKKSHFGEEKSGKIQYSLTEAMFLVEKEKMEIFSSQLRAALDESADNPTGESALHLGDMLSVQNSLDQMSEWPFGIYEVLYVTIIIIVPLIVVLLEAILGIIN